MAGPDDGGEARRAQSIERDPGDRLREPREQSGHSGDVSVVLARLVRGAEIDVLDLRRVDARPLDGRSDRRGCEVVRPDVRQRAAVPPDGRADGGEDHCATHDPTLSRIALVAVRDFLRNPFSFLFTRSSGEDRIAQYVIREHQRGRALAEILEDPYIKNRTTPQERARLLDRPEVVRALGHDVVESAKPS